MQTTILLVEDNNIQKLANERILHKAGYTVLSAKDGEEALRLAREAIPEIILLGLYAAQVRRQGSNAEITGARQATSANEPCDGSRGQLRLWTG